MKTIVKMSLALMAFLMPAAVYPCSRVVFTGSNDIVMVGRTLDWRTPIPTNLYVYPRGVAKQSMPSGPMLQWTSQYASVVAVGYDGGVTEGMNEAGLVMNGLFCKGSVYKVSTGTGDTPVMSLAMIVSYFLDNFATVDQVDQWLTDNQFAIFGKTFDGGTVSLLHWAITDRTGTTLVMEYTDGNLNIYKGADLKVLTNDPTLPEMQAINKYWTGVGGQNMLPGTVRSADRFVRASYFISHVPTDVTTEQAFAEVTSVINNVAVPSGYEIPGQPNLSSTQWKSCADLKDGIYYFTFADCPGYFWVDLTKLDLAPGAPILKLDTTNHVGMMGCINKLMRHSPGFTPMW